jgi:hypothetical protein
MEEQVMPIEITNVHAEDLDEQAEIDLFTKDGELTLEAEVLAGFIASLDCGDLFEDEDVREFIESETGFYREDEDGEMVACEKDAEGAQELTIESLDGEIAALFIDEDDMLAMFEHYVENLPEETLEEKARKAVFTEGFKKGAFKKIHAGGGKTLVNRMLGAMMAKGAIKKAGSSGTKYKEKGVTAKGGVTPGKGYAGGDYTKASGYAPGTGGGIKKWMSYKGKHASDLKKAGKKAIAGSRALKAKGMAAEPKTKTTYKAKKGAQAASAKGLAKAKKAGAKKSMMASVEAPAANLNESASILSPKTRYQGARLAGAILETVSNTPKAEEKK